MGSEHDSCRELLAVGNELAAGASESRGRAVAAVLAAHGALEAFVNGVGGEEIAKLQLPGSVPAEVARSVRANARRPARGGARPGAPAGPSRHRARIPGRSGEAGPPVPHAASGDPGRRRGRGSTVVGGDGPASDRRVPRGHRPGASRLAVSRRSPDRVPGNPDGFHPASERRTLRPWSGGRRRALVG
jgi:hypothetical protein